MRNITSNGRLGARPQRNDDAVKPATDVMSRFLRPNRLASQPVIGRMMALATRYEVRTQVASSMVADMLPAMCGSDTFTTVVSSTSMKVAHITATAISQGFTAGCPELVDDIRASTSRAQAVPEETHQCLEIGG